jgi:hypothetical protein
MACRPQGRRDLARALVAIKSGLDDDGRGSSSSRPTNASPRRHVSAHVTHLPFMAMGSSHPRLTRPGAVHGVPRQHFLLQLEQHIYLGRRHEPWYSHPIMALTLQQVAQHNNEKCAFGGLCFTRKKLMMIVSRSCWVIIDNMVYDVTDFLSVGNGISS